VYGQIIHREAAPLERGGSPFDDLDEPLASEVVE
jgi:hypothetical protein